MRVLYDSLGFSETVGGVSRYFTELMRNFPSTVLGEVAAVESNNKYLQEEPFALPPMRLCLKDFIMQRLKGRSFPGIRRFYMGLARLFPAKFPSGELANLKKFQQHIQNLDFDILHVTAPHPQERYWKYVVGKRPIVATVHDLIPELIYNNQQVKRARAQLLQDASHVIAVSQNTKNDLVRLYGISPDKVTVIYHGYQGRVKENTVWNHNSGKPYLLYVGKRGGYKNWAWFVRAVAPLLKDKDNPLRLFCTGSPFSQNEKELLAELSVESQVDQAYVSDAQMLKLFENAVAFVYPSRYEGFGIPILDAFAVGCPVLLSNASCFPEVGADAALYFDLDDVCDLRGKIRKILPLKESDNLEVDARRHDLIVRGKDRVSIYTWARCTEETVRVYSRVMEKM